MFFVIMNYNLSLVVMHFVGLLYAVGGGSVLLFVQLYD
jgi:hypothetical protein